MSSWAERGKKLTELLGEGFAEEDPAWLALVALQGGVFLRSQYEAWGGKSRWAAHRLVTRLTAAGLLRELDAGWGLGRYCHLHARALYAALGMGDSRHRRRAAGGVLLQRLLAVDYIVAQRHRPWLAGVDAQLRALRARGVGEAQIPRRVYSSPGGETVAYLPARWPLALSEREALFVFPDSGGSYQPRRDLRTWAAQYAGLWNHLLQAGTRVGAVFVTRSERRAAAVRRELIRWCEEGVLVPVDEDPSALAGAEELARVRAGIAALDASVLTAEGGLSGALRRLSVLEAAEAERSGGGGGVRACLSECSTWVSARLQQRADADAGAPQLEQELDVERVGVAAPDVVAR